MYIQHLNLPVLLNDKHFIFLRSISVPYAYQCCAFVGCDSVTTSFEKEHMKKTAGGDGGHVNCMCYLSKTIVCSVSVTPSPTLNIVLYFLAVMSV